MAIFQHRDGQLRIYEHGRGGIGGAGRTASGVTNYFEILFCDANLSAPIGRNFSEERIILDRGVFDSNAHYVQSNDAARLEPINLTFSCKLYDKSQSNLLGQMLSGSTVLVSVGGVTYPLKSRSGKGMLIPGLSKTIRPPAFLASSGKIAFKIEVLYSGTSNYGYRWDEAFFNPGEQSMTEAEDSVTLNLNAKIFGGVTRIFSFHSDAASGDTLTAIVG